MELMGDYSNKEQLEILLPKFKEVINKVHVVNEDCFSLLPEEKVDEEISFF